MKNKLNVPTVVHDSDYIDNINNVMIMMLICKHEMFGTVYNLHDGRISEVITGKKIITGGSNGKDK